MSDRDGYRPENDSSLHARVRELETRERKYKDRIKDLLRQIYGKKSERLSEPRPPGPAKAHGRGGRHELPGHLRCRRVIVDLPAKEKKGLVEIHREYREHLEYEPASLFRVLQIIPVYAHPKKAHPPRKAPIPPRVIPQAGVGPALLAHLLVAKYVDHAPLARQCTIIARAGIKLARQKLCHWVEKCAHLLLSVYQQLAERVRGSAYIQADETPVPIRDRTKRGKTRQGYFWVYLAPQEEAVVFDCHLSRHRRAVESFIPKYKVGSLQADGYEAYAAVAESRPLLAHFGCNGHARRKVMDAFEGGDKSAAVRETLMDIRALYEIERRARDFTDDARSRLRHRECPPIFARLRARYEAAMVQKPVRRRFRKAAQYALTRWAQLTRYAAPGFGHIHIDTNAVERAIRPVKLGVKNFLFLGSPEAGWRSAVVYSVVGTCRLLHIDPESYLHWVLPKLAEGTNQNTAEGLLPHDYAAILAARRKK